jgi:hypothetical protein
MRPRIVSAARSGQTAQTRDCDGMGGFPRDEHGILAPWSMRAFLGSSKANESTVKRASCQKQRWIIILLEKASGDVFSFRLILNGSSSFLHPFHQIQFDR